MGKAPFLFAGRGGSDGQSGALQRARSNVGPSSSWPSDIQQVLIVSGFHCLLLDIPDYSGDVCAVAFFPVIHYPILG